MQRIVGTMLTSAGWLGLALLPLVSPAARAHDLPDIAAEQTSVPPEVWAKINEIRTLRRFLAEEAAKATSKDVEVELVIDLSATWSDRRVSVCFLDGGIDARLHVVEVARRWMEATGLQFDFGPADSPRTCDPARPSNIRVTFVGLGARSFVGKESKQIPAKLATMTLGQMDKGVFSDEDDGTILHEFGHAIGFQHEHQSPASTCKDEFNWDFVYRKLAAVAGWNREKVDANFKQLMLPSTRLLTSAFDPELIMLYSLSRDYFRTDIASPSCFIPNKNTVISQTDREAAATVYPVAVSMRSFFPRKRGLFAPKRDAAVTQAIKRLKELTDTK